MRTLCIAYKDLNGTEDLNKCTNKIYEVESKNLTFFAIVGIMDNLRDNVDKAVA
jgi:Ca2+ transporting ATPase